MLGCWRGSARETGRPMIFINLRRQVLNCPGVVALIPPAWVTDDTCCECGGEGLVAFFRGPSGYFNDRGSGFEVEMLCFVCGSKSRAYPYPYQLPDKWGRVHDFEAPA